MAFAKEAVFFLLPLLILKADQQTIEGSCPKDFVDINGHCYYFSEEVNTIWAEALKKCQSMDPPASLLTLETKEEWDSVMAYITDRDNLNEKFWWVGATDRAQEGRWVWEKTNETLAFSDWCIPTQPDNNWYGEPENCMEINAKNYSSVDHLCWNDLMCDDPTSTAYYICEV